MGFGSWLTKKAGVVAAGLKAGAGYVWDGARQAGNVAKEVGNRVLGLPEAGLNALGVLPAKKLRLRVFVLADGPDHNVLGVPTANVAGTVDPAIRLAKEIFWREARISIVAAGGQLVTVDPVPSPPAALTVHCDGDAYLEDFQAAGDYFQARIATNAIGSALGTGAPVTAFIVKEVVGKAGCSLGPLVDYVTVKYDAVTGSHPRALAHELAHACGLPHTEGIGGALFGGDPATNLMNPSGSGEDLTRRQVILFRNSRHVTFL
jgi:hypothetical protein